MASTVLVVHIAAGSIAVLAAAVAIVSKSANLAHRVHVAGGLTFVGAMGVVVVSALVLSLLRANDVMLLISLFSAYFVWAGLRFARNRQGTPTTVDRVAAWAMAAVSIGMLVWGGLAIAGGEFAGIIGVVFGVIGGLATREDLAAFNEGGLRGRRRIEAHLGRMLGATIATVTAVMVTNVDIEPVWIAWLAPTAVLLPVIVWWERRLRAGARPRGMPAARGTAADA